MNGDGLTDLVVNESSSEAVRVLQQDATHRFSPLSGSVMGLERATQIGVADCDGDGKKDLVRLLAGGVIEVLRGDGAGGFTRLASDRFSLPGDASNFTLADLDRDERMDIVALGTGSASLYILRNRSRRGASLFELLPTIAAGPSGSQPIALSVADFDADGLPDIAVARAGDSRIVLFNNRSF